MEEDSLKDSMEEEVFSFFSEEENKKRALQRWKMMGSEEKAFFRKRMEEEENAIKVSPDSYWFSGPPMEIFTIAATQEASSDIFPIVDEGFDGSCGFEADAQAKDYTHNNRQGRM